MLYGVLKTMSWLASHTPYKLLVKLGKGLGRLYWQIAKKQRVRAEQTIRERLGYDEKTARETIKRLFINLGISVLEMLHMPALNKDNIRGLVSFDHPEILWEALQEKKGVLLLGQTVLVLLSARTDHQHHPSLFGVADQRILLLDAEQGNVRHQDQIIA